MSKARQVGWYCVSCEAVRPMNHQLCRCLDASEDPITIAKYQANYWYPVRVDVRDPKGKPNAKG